MNHPKNIRKRGARNSGAPASYTDLPFLSRSQVATRFGVCTKTIKRWENSGLLTPIVVNSRVVRYQASEVEQLVANALRQSVGSN